MKKKATSKTRKLKAGELGTIKEWLLRSWKDASDGMQGYRSVSHLRMDCTPCRHEFGRYANPDTSSALIYEAAQFVTRLQFPNRTVKSDTDLHALQFHDLRDRMKANDFQFFECVATMLRHRSQRKTIIAKIPWRDMQKFAVKSARSAQRMSLTSAMEYAVFHVLNRRSPLPALGNDSTQAICTAVKRDELREALRCIQEEAGISPPSQVSEPQLSTLLNKTSSGKFLAPFMDEQPIMRRKQKLQPPRNRER